MSSSLVSLRDADVEREVEDETRRQPAMDGVEEGSDDDLFGADDDPEDVARGKTSLRPEGNEAENEESSGKVQPRRSVSDRSSSPSSSASHPAKERAPRRGSDSVSASEPDEDQADLSALEHRETSIEPPMGYRQGVGQFRQEQEQQEEVQEASFSLPSLPLRRGAPHYFARLPNLLQYRPEAFEEADFDEKLEDEVLRNKEGFQIDDAGLRSLLTTNNTIRWRWHQEPAKQQENMQSNARIIRWSDGSSSLQLGKEFYDIQETRERGAAAAAASSSTSSPVTNVSQPAQYLTHIFVKHDGQEALNIYQAEAPVMASMTLRPTSTASDSHQRLARAVRHQRGTLVKEAKLGMDPELEKERKEREDRKREQKRARELKRRRGGAGAEGGVAEDADDDAFWANVSRTRRMGPDDLSTAAARSLGAGKSKTMAGVGSKQHLDEVVEGVDDVSRRCPLLCYLSRCA
ncbi:hypothetical protein FA10DRAFT_140639 [Acaromyces ingoldii]|uniref:Leo1-domain-containing protein n=1 Tax=Acaromyces ingoldii TaxID=215250 RepID=A0A316YKV8_9BASI|nr:hypothetical protein FA10DRAFT_140639 [Acaromyces ingoldii]PWN89278.1 hypothetical protein FA10DRAFT_140639 [Acaromyces ingoldii]